MITIPPELYKEKFLFHHAFSIIKFNIIKPEDSGLNQEIIEWLRDKEFELFLDTTVTPVGSYLDSSIEDSVEEILYSIVHNLKIHFFHKNDIILFKLTWL